MEPIVIVKDLSKSYDLRSNFFESLFSKEERYLKAVDKISFNIMPGETFGLVGESGCGKTTTGRLIINTIRATGGQVFFEGTDLATVKDRESLKKLALKMQMIFQDPYEYLSPWLNVRDTLAEPLRIHNIIDEDQIEDRVKEAMETVGLAPVDMILPKYSYQLSGGQRQRVGIARALMLNPTFLVADEPVSMLDVSIRVGVLNLLKELKNKFNLTSLFITHDIAVSRYMCDRIAVMYLGKIVEMGPTEDIISDPLHPYTQALIAAVPSSGVNLPPGCRFSPRCPYSDSCDDEEPELIEIEKDRFVMCHKALKR